MSKAGKVIGQAAESVVKAGGVVTKRGGEVISDVGKNMGISEKTCSKIEEKADDFGKDLYYASGKVGKTFESFSNKAESETKKAYHSVVDKLGK